jgi:hypothetical protein
MINAITSFISKKVKKESKTPETSMPAAGLPVSGVPTTIEPRLRPSARPDVRKAPTYSKAFRWRIPQGRPHQPATVEVVGSFTGWQKAPLAYDPPTKTWQVTLHNIQGNRTHHYAILVDGKPALDSTSDGLAMPADSTEAQWQVETEKGPRVMLLFGQAK